MKQRKAKARARKGKPITQVGAIPFRLSPSGDVEILLVTSRGTSRFVIPKGWRMKGKLNPAAAALEAAQEAGATGQVAPEPYGTYRYWKRLRTMFVPVTVMVYPLMVEAELPQWKERRQRRTKWVTVAEAASLVDEPELVHLIESFRGTQAMRQDSDEIEEAIQAEKPEAVRKKRGTLVRSGG